MSVENTGKSDTPHLHAADLVDDRELADAEDDRLGHEGVVRQLAALVTEVRTPSNIALYGPWGSGKTGIANLLKAEVDRKNGVRFVRFDAFKYADVPLRRNFISAVAKGLGQSESKYHADLYSGRTKTDISVPPATILKLLGVFAALMIGLTLILAGVVAGIVLVQQGDFLPSFRSLLTRTVLAGLLPASLLAALIALASKTFSVDRSLAKPESDEQFEQLFTDLVAHTRAKRLVVFVDELDRCSATEVVATLDTVRTFLGIERCVFIIAADQNVLEEALTRAAKQETPANEANPYYSTGSAYLDKVFQYQVSLPPLLTQSVSKYANSLVGSRAGVWAEINVEYVLSVLIPTHVTSPRRVKHLLNTFALTYRLAQERHRVGLLSEDPRGNAPAIARLVCMRVEFPLFARHLEVDARLPELVLELVRDSNTIFSSEISDRAQQLARSYALDDAPPATVLIPDEEDRESAEELSAPTIKAHNKQLLNYLSRTRQISGPSRDLIYMQSSGTVFGLDGELALSVEQAAEDGNVDALKHRIAGLSEEQTRGALELLSHQIRTGSGIIGPNTARSFLLLSAAVPDLQVEHVVDSIIEAICRLHDESVGVLDEETVESAWRLAKLGSEDGSAALRRSVITATIDPNSSATSDFLVDDALVALDAAPRETTSYLSSLLLSKDGVEALERLFAAPNDGVVQVLGLLREDFAHRCNAALTAHGLWVKATNNTTAVAGTRTTAASQTSTQDEPYNPQELLQALVKEAAPRETPVQHETLRLLLAVNHLGARSAAEKLIPQSEPAEQSELIAAMLESASRRVSSSWSTWFKGIAEKGIQPSHSALLTNFVLKLWMEDPPASDPGATLSAMSPLISALPEGELPDLTAKVTEALENWVSDEDEALARRQFLSRAEQFIDAGFADRVPVAEAVVSTLQDTLAQALAPVERDSELYQYVSLESATALATCATSLSDAELNGIVSEAASSPWVDDVGHIELPLILASSALRSASDIDGLPTAQAVADIAYNYGRLATNAATLWVTLVKPEPEELAPVLDRLLREDAISSEFSNAAQEAQQNWSSTQRRIFLELYILQSDSPVPSDLTLRTIGLATTEDTEVAIILCSRFSQATNNSQRQAVIELWAKAEIEDLAARKKLIETIIYGLIDLHVESSRNSGAVELALTALDNLGAPLPRGVKGALGERLRKVIEGNKSLEDRALRVLPRLGYPTFKKGILNRVSKVDYTD